MGPPRPQCRPTASSRLATRVLTCLAISLLSWIDPGAAGADAAKTAPRSLVQLWTEALGGAERLGAVRTGYIRESLRFHGAPGVEETWFDASGAHRTRRDILGRVTEVVFDGARGWRVDWSGRVFDWDRPDEGFQSAYYYSASNLLPKRRRGSVVPAGMDSLGRPALRVTAQGGYPETFYFDPATGLPARVERRFDDGRISIREYADWRDVKGIRMPYLTVMLREDGIADSTRIEEVRWDEASPPAAFARPEPGPKPWRLADGSAARDIPIRVENNHIMVRGTMQGRDSVTVILDSGASVDLMLAARAQALGLAPQGQHNARGAGGLAASSTVTGVDLSLPSLSLARHTFGMLPLDQLGPQSGRPIDAIIGYPLFSRNVVEIDYENRRMTVYEGEGWEYHGRGAILPLSFEDDLPYVHARVKLPGHAPVDGRFVLDTGSSGNLTLSPDWVAKQRALAAVGRTIEIVGRGVGGESRNPIGRVERLELGGFAMERPLAVFRGAGAGEISAPGTAGNIGGGILRRFKVIFDYPRDRLILEPNERLGEPFEYDMSGLGLRAVPPEYRKVQVGLVLPNSPAADLGIAPGDEIETLDGRPPGELGLDAIRKMFRREGTSVQLRVRHGDDRRTVTLVTRRMI